MVHGWLALQAEGIEPLDLLRSAEGQRGGRCYYASRSGWEVAGLGEALSLEARGARRFQDLARQARACLASLETLGGGAGPGPVLLGGFSFDREEAFAEDSPWHGFSAARLVLPELAIVRSPSGTWLVGASEVEAPQSEARLTERLLAARTLLQEMPPSPSPSTSGLTPSSDDDDEPEHYEQRVRGALDAIVSGDLTKVTVARTEVWRASSPPRTIDLLDALGVHFPDCFRFCIEPAGAGSFVGASPERLVAVHRGRVEADALAGTRPRGLDPEQDRALAEELLGNDKEQREHEAVVAYLNATLGPVVDGLDEPGKPQLLKLSNVQHLHTPISGELSNGEGVLELAGLVHPTPAVCGLPRSEALGWLSREEDLERGWYAGGVGMVRGDGDGEFCVAIRSGLVRDETVWLYAGAGIVEGSHPEQERAEVDHKLQGMREVLLDAGP